MPSALIAPPARGDAFRAPARLWSLLVGAFLLILGGWLALRGSPLAGALHILAGSGILLLAFRASTRALAAVSYGMGALFLLTGLVGLGVDDLGALGFLDAFDNGAHFAAGLLSIGAAAATHPMGQHERRARPIH